MTRSPVNDAFDPSTGRVAIYAVPGTGGSQDEVAATLRARAESWLGRAVDGSTPPASLPNGWSRADVDDITVDARRYGFHGTLKAPFRLDIGARLDDLDAELASFAGSHDAVEIPHLTLTVLGGFFALVAGEPTPVLDRLAADVVTQFDAYRAAPTDADLKRRNLEKLTAAQRSMLKKWGYPYVLDEFTFHLTVTDRIPEHHRDHVDRTLTSWFADCMKAAIAIESLALFTESEPGAPFRLHSVHPLRPPTAHDTEGRR